MHTKYNIYYYNDIDEKFIVLKENYKNIAEINIINITSVDNIKLKEINDIAKMYNSMPIYEIETEHFMEIAAIGDNVYRILELDLKYESDRKTDKTEYQ